MLLPQDLEMKVKRRSKEVRETSKKIPSEKEKKNLVRNYLEGC